MASYSSYKKVSGASITDGTIPGTAFGSGVFDTWCVKWIYGTPNICSPGCCCLWTVPTGVRRLHFEIWGAGGNGHGACSSGRCQHFAGAQGGYYNSKMITTAVGCQYTICAAGVHPCTSVECQACDGCTSFVNGYNLSGFCALGGTGGCANGSWNTACHSDWGRCCMEPGGMGGDFGMGNHRGTFFIQTHHCHCHCKGGSPTSAPFMGTSVQQGLINCWSRCACATSPYAHGGQGGMSTYCGGGNCCAKGMTGGPGLVKISFL